MSVSCDLQGRIQDFWKGVGIYKGRGGGGGHFANFISYFLNIQRK